MDLLQRARELYVAGRMHDALEVAQAACDRSPKNAEAWALLGRISRFTGMPAASDLAFRRAATLAKRQTQPYRVPPDGFDKLLSQAQAKLSPDARRRLERTAIRVQALPSVDQVRSGIDPDALTVRARDPQDVLTVFQVNHENRAGSEDALRSLITRSLSRA
jgi:hypothetical protein